MGNSILPLLLVLFQRMSADIKSQYLLFKRQQIFLGILRHIRYLHFKGCLILLRSKIKETHLTCKIFLFLLCRIIHHLTIDHHHLTAVSSKTVERTRLDKVFHGSLIHFFSGRAVDKVCQIFKRPSGFPFPDQFFNHRFSNTLNRIQSIPDGSV